MNQKRTTQPVKIVSVAKTSDGSGGFTSTGETIIFECNATVTEGTASKFQGAESSDFTKQFTFTFFKPNSLIITTANFVKFRDERLKIVDVENIGNDLKIKLKAKLLV